MSSHLNALNFRLSHERERLNGETTEDGRKLRAVWIAQIEKEISVERAFLGLPSDDSVQLSDEELLKALEE